MKPTDEQIEAGAKALAALYGENWECVCTDEKGLNCDCGDAMPEEKLDKYDEGWSREDCRLAARTVLEAQS